MGIVNWDESIPAAPKKAQTNADGTPKEKVNYLKLQAGNSYVVRPVGKCFQVWKYFVQGKDGKIRSVIVEKPDECGLKARHPELEAKEKYVFNVFDRNDNNTLKVMEFAPSIYTGFKKWYDKTKKMPGGEKGGDFSIDAELPSDGDKRRTKYTCQFLEPVPFSDKEKEIANGGLYNLPEIYKAQTEEEMEKILFGGSVPSGNRPAQTQSRPAPAPAKVAQATQAVSEESSSEESGDGPGW